MKSSKEIQTKDFAFETNIQKYSNSKTSHFKLFKKEILESIPIENLKK
jgi:hypothetical protein